MEKNHMKSASLVEIELVTTPSIPTHWHGFIELLYVISGHLTLTAGEEHSELKPRDIVVINANRHHSYQGSPDLLLGRFLISDSKIEELLAQSPVLFWCNSTAEEHDAFPELRRILNRILSDSLNTVKWNRIYRESLYYRLLHVLCSNFLVPQGDIRFRSDTKEGEDRLQEIFAYIRSHYHQNIRLKDLADTLYLSETYVSRYIKKQCGINFVELVNTVRLEHSMEELIDSNTPILKIAMDNGFASVAAYNKYFREQYQMNPTDYRRQIQAERAKSCGDPTPDPEEQKVREKVSAFLEADPDKEEDESHQEISLSVKTSGSLPAFDPMPQLAIINVGPMSELLKSELRQQILASKNRLGFRFVRFNDPFGETMYVDIHAPTDSLNFGRMDTVLDFLVQNQLIPYFELGYKPRRLLRSTEEAVYDEIPPEKTFSSDSQMYEFYVHFLRHLLRRYGAKELATWYFEVHEPEQLYFYGQSFHFHPMTVEEHCRYFHDFDIIASAIRSLPVPISLGGGGFPAQHYGEEGMKEIFDLWAQSREHPDFITITSFPYRLQKEGRYYFERRSTDTDFLLHNIRLVKRALEASELSTVFLHVTEYGISLSGRSVINDSCYKAAFLMRSLIACSQESDVLLGHWHFSDLYADYEDTGHLLFGGSGLLSKNGIPKPSWYAFDFFRSAFSHLVARTEQVLVTSDGMGNFRLLCHNMKTLSYGYYASREDLIPAGDLPQQFEDQDPLLLHTTLTDLFAGNYHIRRRRVNASCGNLLTSWRELSLESDLSIDDLEHLRKTTTYHLSAATEAAPEGILALSLSLEANEITVLEISPKF